MKKDSKTVAALAIYPDGTTKTIKLDRWDDEKRLDQMQEIVGGDIEILKEFDVLKVWGNDNGYNLKLPQNPVASIVAKKLDIVGPVLITGRNKKGFGQLDSLAPAISKNIKDAAKYYSKEI